MARKTKSYSRGGHTYELTQLGGMEGAELSVTVLNIAASLLPLLMSARGGIGGLDVSAIRIDWGQVRPLIEAFGRNACVVGQGGRVKLEGDAFDLHFAGDLDGIVEMLLQGLELNYARFLEQRLGLSLSAAAELWAKLSASPSPTGSPGTPGE